MCTPQKCLELFHESILLLVAVAVVRASERKGVVAVRMLEEDPDQLQGMARSKKPVTREETGNTSSHYAETSSSDSIEEEQDELQEQEADGEDEGQNDDQEEVDEEGEQEDSEEVEHLRRMVDVVLKWRSLPPGEADMASAFKMADDVLMHLTGKGVASSATTTSGGNEPARKSEHDIHAT
ncbi:hypothetical protein Sjap_005302 [Stephania japonica]|uniref:Uncharacterized protein n=1 Tax=Stephania japonica TaxID=461633 RepID=A0AAP0K5B4_9MAGN